MSLDVFCFGCGCLLFFILIDGLIHIAMVKFCPKMFWNLYHQDILNYFEDKFVDERIEKL